MSGESFADTIVPKSDQLNADDLLVGPITVTVQAVKRGDREQPVTIEIDGGRMPYKPCKSMRRVLIAAWGDKGADWVGKRMTLYCDQNVVFGGVKVGGIRISHLSHIERDRDFMLTTSRSKRSEFHVKRLDDAATQPAAEKPPKAKPQRDGASLTSGAIKGIEAAESKERVEEIRKSVNELLEAKRITQEQYGDIQVAIAKKVEALSNTTTEPTDEPAL